MNNQKKEKKYSLNVRSYLHDIDDLAEFLLFLKWKKNVFKRIKN